MDRAEIRLRRLDQQDRFGKTVVVKAAPEMHPRFDRDDLEAADVQSQVAKRKQFDDLDEIRAQNQDIIAVKLYDDPKLTVTFHGVQMVPRMRTGWPADSSANPPTSMSKASPAFAPRALSSVAAAASVIVAIKVLDRSCAIISRRSQVA